ncbi:MAG: PEP-CTERM sorting domain-containing protein [Verrucomicrobiota bacterium]|nr:PEP-CTERM sorting domain-containing protein [Verrucomicrobiota bacterium]
MKRSNRLFSLAVALASLAISATTASAVTPIDQITGTTFGSASASQRFEDANSAFNIGAIDDFTVGGSTLRLQTVDAVFLGFGGFTSYSNVISWAVEIYSSRAAAGSNLTGNVVHVDIPAGSPNVTVTTGFVGGNAASALVSLNLNSFTVSNLLANTTYYLAVIPQLNFGGGGGQLGVYQTTGGTPGGSNAFQANPAGGFGFGATQDLNANLAYRLTGTAVPEPSSAFSFVLGGGALLAALFLRRRRGAGAA